MSPGFLKAISCFSSLFSLSKNCVYNKVWNLNQAFWIHNLPSPPPPKVHMKYCWWFITLVQPNIFISWLFQFVCALVKTLGFTKYINTWFMLLFIYQYCIARNYYIWLWFGVSLVLSWTSDKRPVAWLKDWGKHKNHTLSNEKLPYGSSHHCDKEVYNKMSVFLPLNF